MVALSLLVAAVLVSGIAQFLFRAGSYGAGVGATALAIGLTWASARSTPAAPRDACEPVTWRRIIPCRPRLAIVAVLALAVTLWLRRQDLWYPWQLLLWSAAVVLTNAAYRSPGQWPRWRSNRLGAEAVLVAVVVAAGLVVRVYHLGAIPGGFYGDEGEFGLRALAVLDGVRTPPFATGWDFHPTLFSYIEAGVMRLAGRDVGGLRLTSALAGSATLLAWYLFLRGVAGTSTAVAGTALLAVSPWNVQFSRIASNDAFVTLLTVISMAAFYRATRSGRASTYVLAGSTLGLCLYFGNKAVMLPPMVLAGLAAIVVADGRRALRHWPLWGLAAVVALGVFAPQLSYYLTHDWRAALLSHPGSKLASLDVHAAGGGSTLAALVRHQVERSLLGFHYYADAGFFHSSTSYPLLSAGEATFYLVGLAWCVWRWRTPLAAFLLAWFGVGLLGSLLSRDPPQAHHMVGISPLPAAFAALAIQQIGARAAALTGYRWRLAIPIGGVLLVAAIAGSALREYFVGYAASWPSLQITEIARAMRDVGPTHRVVLVTAPVMLDRNATIRFIAPGVQAEMFSEVRPDAPWRGPTDRDVAFVVDAQRRAALTQLRQWYPTGRLRAGDSASPYRTVQIFEVLHADLVAHATRLP